MKLKMKLIRLTRSEINRLKSYLMSSYRYCKRVFESIEEYSQYQTWLKLCYIHLNNCNYWCDKLKPRLIFLMPSKKKLYNDLYSICKFTIESLQDDISEYNSMHEKHLEEMEFAKQIEMRARIEHELALEFREEEIEHRKELIEKRPIGYNYKNTYDNETYD